MASVTLRGNPFNLKGSLPANGSAAPDFTLTKADLSEIRASDLAGKKTVIVTVPSLDTPVCQTETRKFNEKAAALDNVQVLIVSADLPFAQKRFCETEGISSVTAASDVRDRGFGERFGVQIAEGPLAGVMARAVFVTDENGKIVYQELVGEIADEPDYDKALAALGG